MCAVEHVEFLAVEQACLGQKSELQWHSTSQVLAKCPCHTHSMYVQVEPTAAHPRFPTSSDRCRRLVELHLVLIGTTFRKRGSASWLRRDHECRSMCNLSLFPITSLSPSRATAEPPPCLGSIPHPRRPLRALCTRPSLLPVFA